MRLLTSKKAEMRSGSSWLILCASGSPRAQLLPVHIENLKTLNALRIQLHGKVQAIRELWSVRINLRGRVFM
jgi:hypothetical protein